MTTGTTKTVKITLAGTGRTDIHDGLGGIHLDGQTVTLPTDVADAFVAGKFAHFVDGSSSLQAIGDAKDRAEAHTLATVKYRSQQMMAIYDNLPAPVRAATQEHGDEVIEDYLSAQIAKHPRAAVPLTKTGEPDFDAIDLTPPTNVDPIVEGSDAPEPPDTPTKRRRGRPRKDGT